MLKASSKGTVPVLCLASGTVIDESIDIMQWAVANSSESFDVSELHNQLVVENDGSFKGDLDRYKYFDRYPEHPQEFYWQQLSGFLYKLDSHLIPVDARQYSTSTAVYLDTQQASLLDWAILPFVRQCYYVSPERFESLGLVKLNTWLTTQLNSDIFVKLMRKKPFWHIETDPTYQLLEP
jgi:hypothetical protein